MSGGVLYYVQHLMGIGHQRRAAAVSRALCRQGLTVTYVSGGFPIPDLDVGPADFVQLPPARSADMRYHTLLGENGEAVTDTWRAARRDQLLQLLHERCPRALLVETYPFGRKLMRFELDPLLQAAHGQTPRPLVLCSIRDILEQWPRPGRYDAIVAAVQNYFDAVLVHGDPAVVPLEATFPRVDDIRDKLHYTGYVLNRDKAGGSADVGKGEVVVSAGGGAFGQHVLRTALRAREYSILAHRPWRILVGSNVAPEDFDQLKTMASEGVIVERNRPDFARLLANCALSISQGGYNTVLEVIAAGARAVVVPYADDSEQEQAVRARVLAAQGLVHVVDDQKLTAETLADAVDRAWNGQGPNAIEIDMDGANGTARLMKRMLEQSA